MMNDRRFLEESFPVKEVSQSSVTEKNIRHGHISTLHIWWARRPLAASRATAYAALVPACDDIEAWLKRRDFIVDLCRWENSHNSHLLERARREIYAAHAARLSEELGQTVTVEDIESGRYPPPRVLDPFAGGGSYPLESLRLGCEAYANDYNPVAVLIEKAILEYPQKFGRSFKGMTEWAMGESGKKKTKSKKGDIGQLGFFSRSQSEDANPLMNAVRYWSSWVLEEVRGEMSAFYPPGPDGNRPVGYIWARTVPCQNPACGVEIPLMHQHWLANKKNKQIALRTISRGPGQPVAFEIVARGKEADSGRYAPWPEGFDPESGSVRRAIVTCPACGATINDKITRRLFQQGFSSQRMVAVVLATKGGKTYRLPTEADLQAYRAAEEALKRKVDALREDWGMEPVPGEPTPEGKGRGAERAFSVRNYGLRSWGDLFNPRQQLSLLTFADAVRRAYQIMLECNTTTDFAQAVTANLALSLSRHSSYNSSLCWWEPLGERSFNTFGRQALPMVFDYSEQVPFDTLTGTWKTQSEISLEIIASLSQKHLSNRDTPRSRVTNVSATCLPYPNNYFDAVLTDPPYYDNVAYSYLSDFFYVWLKRTVGHLYPELFSTPLAPKHGEIVAYSHGEGGHEAGKRLFEEQLRLAFREIQRVLKPDGVAVIVYAHKSTAGWETVLNALLDSGLVVSAAWPIYTEMQSRLRANKSAALASSIYIAARKAARQPTGFYSEVRAELRRHMDARLQRLWEEGVGGADFFIAAIGSAIEVFGKYQQVMDYEGNLVRADRLLDEVRAIAADFAVRQILHNGFAAELSPLARFYLLWRWNYGEAVLPFDEANKLAHSCGLDLNLCFNKHTCVRKEKEFVRLLGPQARRLDDLKEPSDLIDVLHKALLLWERSERDAMMQVLVESGFGHREAFYRLAQAISETLPVESKEKKLLDGFLVSRRHLQEKMGQMTIQESLL